MYILLSGVSPFRGTDSEETRQNVTFVRYRFEYLYKELSQEATRFLILVFKRAPGYVGLYNLCSIVLILVSSTSRTLLCKEKPGKVHNFVTILYIKGPPSFGELILKFFIGRFCWVLLNTLNSLWWSALKLPAASYLCSLLATFRMSLFLVLQISVGRSCWNEANWKFHCMWKMRKQIVIDNLKSSIWLLGQLAVFVLKYWKYERNDIPVASQN